MNTGFVNDWIRRSQTSSFNPGGMKEDLFLLFCDKVRDGSIIPQETDSYAVVDNFYVNGDFVYRKDVSVFKWKQVKKDAIVSTDDIAILRF